MTAVRRLRKEYRDIMAEIETDPTFFVQPFEDDYQTWHFSIMGPSDSEYARGLYHGRIIFPNEYPFKPPEISLLMSTGRFHVNKNVCLSVSHFHPEQWQAAWGVRIILMGIRQHFLERDIGSIGHVEMSKEARMEIAEASRKYKCPNCGMDHAEILQSIKDIKANVELVSEDKKTKQDGIRPNDDPKGACPSANSMGLLLAKSVNGSKDADDAEIKETVTVRVAATNKGKTGKSPPTPTPVGCSTLTYVTIGVAAIATLYGLYQSLA